MNETIGAKGGKNDIKRCLVITKKMKERLKKYHEEQKQKQFSELEKKVKHQQILTFLAAVPIAAAGQIYTTLTEDKEKKKELALKEAIDLIQKENLFNEKETNQIIIALKTGTLFTLEEELLAKLGISLEGHKRVSEIDLTDFAIGDKNKAIELSKEQRAISDPTKDAILKAIELTKKTNEDSVNNITPEEQIKAGISEDDKIEEKIDKLKNHKIVDEYIKNLKDVRAEIRELTFEYELISEATDTVYDSDEAEELLEKLNVIIKKIEELKKRIDIPDIDKYDNEYLYNLVSNYIEDFKNKRFVDEIKDSSLYIMISEKLEELDTKKDLLEKRIETKKDTLEINEMHLEQIKEQYFNFEQFNDNMAKIQKEQEKMLEEIRDKMANATTMQERVEVQVVGMQRQGRNLLSVLGASLLRPGARNARGLANMIATYLSFMRNAITPQTITRRYITPVVEDYHTEIENSLSQLDNIETMLQRTSKQIDITIKQFEKEFKEYLDIIPECRDLLKNLEKLKDELQEKEYEINRIKNEQKDNLEKNDAKVKVMTYEETV